MANIGNDHDHKHSDGCDCRPATVTVGQTLDEMDFERGIWTAALDNDSDRVREFISKSETDRRDNSGYTALHYAARQGHEEICRILIDSNCNVNARTNGGATPLHRAAMMGYCNIVNLLIRSGAKANIQDDDGQTPLHRSAAKGFLDISTNLIQCCSELKSIKDKKERIPYDLVPNDNVELKKLLSL